MTGRILEDLSAKLEDLTTTTDREEQMVLFEMAELEQRKGTVVKLQYKLKYKQRAKAAGIKGKAAKRSTWDFIAQVMAAETLNKKAKTDVDALREFFDANEVDYSRWTNTSPGWEGRLRMTGGLALRRIVAERGTLFSKTGEEIPMPEGEVERLAAKFDI
jgi:NADH dehydrogenase/NADH:ubiquinone oxidoreductase subunit G